VGIGRRGRVEWGVWGLGSRLQFWDSLRGSLNQAEFATSDGQIRTALTVRVERLMVRWMCGVSLKNRISSKELHEWIGVVCVADIVRQGRLRC